MITRHSIYNSHTVPAFDSQPESSSFLFLDIETTGLSRENTILYMVGCGSFSEEGLHVIQWFNEDGKSEKQILEALLALLSEKEYLIITFNGDQFDLPYLERRFHIQDLPDPAVYGNAPDWSRKDTPLCEPLLFGHRSLDLYKVLRPWQKVFSMKRGRQKDWEILLGIDRDDTKNGRELIRVYREFLLEQNRSAKKTDLQDYEEEDGKKILQKNKERLDMLFLHNYEDICHLSLLLSLLALKDISDGTFSIAQTGAAFFCRLNRPLPLQIHAPSPHGSVEAEGYDVQLLLPAFTGTLKHFFPNPGSYYYLPREDRAVHKSIGQYVQKEYRRKCTAAECYVKKEGLFLPLYLSKKGKNRLKDLTVYTPEYQSTICYIDYDELKKADESTIRAYVSSCLQRVLFGR